MDFFKREVAGKEMQRKIRELEQETEDDFKNLTLFLARV